MAYALGKFRYIFKGKTRVQELEKKIPAWSSVAHT